MIRHFGGALPFHLVLHGVSYGTRDLSKITYCAGVGHLLLFSGSSFGTMFNHGLLEWLSMSCNHYLHLA